MSLQDDQYVDENDPLIGAAINGDAIRSAMQHVLNTEMGALYVHMHAHHWGQPYFSSIDWRDLPSIVQSLQNANSQLIHGALLFSQDTATGALWPPEQGVCKPVIPRVSIVGYPLKICTGGAS